jgi:hypothetical protein
MDLIMLLENAGVMGIVPYREINIVMLVAALPLFAKSIQP